MTTTLISTKVSANNQTHLSTGFTSTLKDKSSSLPSFTSQTELLMTSTITTTHAKTKSNYMLEEF